MAAHRMLAVLTAALLTLTAAAPGPALSDSVGSMTLTSSAFVDGGTIPTEFTALARTSRRH
jgi:hypothetical protein